MSRKKVISEINVTPLVDVMLVLLIVFIITAPILLPGAQVHLPQVERQTVQAATESSLVVTVTKEGDFFLQDKPITLEELKQSIQVYCQNHKDTNVFIRGDKNARYDFIVKAIFVLKEGGVNKIAILTDTPS